MSDDEEHKKAFEDCVMKMEAAGREWFRLNPDAHARFRTDEFEEKIRKNANVPAGKTIAISAALCDVIGDWADNQDARLLLRALDAGSNYQATYLMAKVLLERVMELNAERRTTHFEEGEWRCTGCAIKLDGFTQLAGDTGPNAGSLSVCSYCGAIQQVNKAVNGYDPITTKEFNKLPKELRKTMLSMQNTARKSAAKKAAKN